MAMHDFDHREIDGIGADELTEIPEGVGDYYEDVRKLQAEIRFRVFHGVLGRSGQ